MDLSCNRHLQQHLQQQQQHQQRAQSEDDEDMSNNSRDYPQSNGGSALNSDSESGPPISVRDMIKRYNSASVPTNKTVVAVMTPPPQRRTSQHILPTTKSSYCGVNKFGSQSNVRQYVSQLQDTVGVEKTKLCCRNCPCNIDNNSNNNSKEDNCCLNPRGRLNSLKSVKSVKSLKSLKANCSTNNETDLNNKLYVADHTSHTSGSPMRDGSELHVIPSVPLNTTTSKERIPLQSADSIEDVNCHPIESSYQSKTTIAKTASGVRIIIDIFFDQEQNVCPTDVIGSRVETDIPQSRILSEFQQQALSTSASQASAMSATIAQTTPQT